MNTAPIEQMAEAAAAGTLPFPAIVGQLITAGVEFYHIDYMRREQTCYSATGRAEFGNIGLR